MSSKANHNWSELPCIDWPPDVPKPSMEDVLSAAEYVMGTGDRRGAVATVLYAAAAVPWLIRHLGFSGVQAYRITGRRGRLANDDPAYLLMVSPAGQAIAHRMTRHLREMRRAELE